MGDHLHGEAFQRIGGPIPWRGIAQYLFIQQTGLTRGNVARTKQLVYQYDLKQTPRSARSLEFDGIGQRRRATFRIALQVIRVRREVLIARANFALTAFAPPHHDRRALQHRSGRHRVANGRIVLRCRQQHPGLQNVGLRTASPFTGRTQRRKEVPLAHHQMRHQCPAKSLRQHAVLVEVFVSKQSSRVRRLHEIIPGRRKVPGAEGQLPQLQHRHRCQIVVHAVHQQRQLQLVHRIGRSPLAGIGQTQLQTDPGLHPAVRCSRSPRQRSHQIPRDHIVLTGRTQDLQPPSQRQRRAPHDFLRIDLQHILLRNDASLLKHLHVLFGRIAPQTAQIVGDLSQTNAARRSTPGRWRPRHALRQLQGCWTIQPHQPILKSQVHLHRRRVLLERRTQIAHLIMALADHRVVRNRIDPDSFRTLRARRRFKDAPSRHEIPIHERSEPRVILGRRYALCSQLSP